MLESTAPNVKRGQIYHKYHFYGCILQCESLHNTWFILCEEHLASKRRRGLTSMSSMSSTCESNAKNTVTNLEKLLHEFGLCTLFLKSFSFLIRPSHFSSNGPYPIHLTRHFSTLPHPDGSDYLKQKGSDLFQEIISFLISFLESMQFEPSFGELEACAKLLSVLGA